MRQAGRLSREKLRAVPAERGLFIVRLRAKGRRWVDYRVFFAGSERVARIDLSGKGRHRCSCDAGGGLSRAGLPLCLHLTRALLEPERLPECLAAIGGW